MKCFSCQKEDPLELKDLKGTRLGKLENGYYRLYSAKEDSVLCPECARTAKSLATKIVKLMNIDPASVSINQIINWIEE